jgi:hypothetical protein
MTTFSDLIQRTLIELRQEPGISVQQYAEDIVAAILQRQFNVFFDHYWWPTYTTNREVMTLNGLDGQVIEDLRQKIKRSDDVRFIWYGTETAPLTAMPPGMNMVTFRRYYENVPNDKIFRILPITTTGTITVTYRTKPAPFIYNDEVKIDDDLLVCATAYNYLADDEDAPNSIKKFAEATAKREEQLREAMNRGPIPYGAPAASPFVDWMTG